MKMMILLGTTVFGWGGWWLGEQISDDITAALILSGIGTIFGVFAGWWAGRKMGV